MPDSVLIPAPLSTTKRTANTLAAQRKAPRGATVHNRLILDGLNLSLHPLNVNLLFTICGDMLAKPEASQSGNH